jgi:ribokinase
MPNAFELEMLTGETEIPKGAALLIEMGVKIVAVKLGGKGCYVTDGHEKRTVEPYKVNVVDTTGAGDAFDAGFLYGLIHDKSIFECGQLGNFVASKSITKMGAREGLPYAKDLALLG